MARLLKTEYPMPESKDFENTRDWLDASDKALSEIPLERHYSYPYADGRAHYYVVSMTPLVLQHIPFLDAWELPDAHIRGLRAQDVLDHVKRVKFWKELTHGQATR